MRTVMLLLALVPTVSLLSESAVPSEPEPVLVTKIRDQGTHSAFTDVIRFRRGKPIR